ncbi:hypothetical protein P154DRAFT_525022 [Amniculicola lignicola CBS 123094]|uniref:TFIIS N-terminal domain-containing protein n=1 Tax=Amniculicola lignicola CBS 123094 TaxID=1392246 RepID=A0A6A5W5W4_9PLEO|nr:hypothetical protein P154DRAFT_525022 [Amniculicola lignicola CBS 123094]
MEDAEFNSDHSRSPLPSAGHDRADPLRPEIDEENSTPNPPGTDVDQDAIEEDGLSDNESVLSELDEGQFENFDASNLDIEERPAQMIDDSNLNLIGVHKRKRLDGEEEAPKKKKKKADKPRRKKRGDDEVSGGDEGAGRKSTRKKKEGRGAGENVENLTDDQRRKRALDQAIDAALKRSSTRRRKKGDIDLEGMADAEIEDMRRRMATAAEADNEGRKQGLPASHKLKLLPEVINLLNKTNLKDSIVDPEINLLEAVRFFLEPLSDGSLPAFDIQKELFTSLAKLPITKESLVASGIGKVCVFYIRSTRPEPNIKRAAERLYADWTRPILRRTDDFRKKEFVQAEYDPTKLPVRSSQNLAAQQAAATRAKALEAPQPFRRARMEPSRTTYTIVPKSNVVYQEVKKGGGDDILKRLKAKR